MSSTEHGRTDQVRFARAVVIAVAILFGVIAIGLALAAVLSPDNTSDSTIAPRPAIMPGPPVRSDR